MLFRSQERKIEKTMAFLLRTLFTPSSSSVRSLHTSSFLLQKSTGNVKWFNVAKGFGFITSSKGEDVFVHYNAIQTNGFRSLREGEPVEFDLSERDGRVQAVNVTGPNGAKVMGAPRNSPPRGDQE